MLSKHPKTPEGRLTPTLAACPQDLLPPMHCHLTDLCAALGLTHAAWVAVNRLDRRMHLFGTYPDGFVQLYAAGGLHAHDPVLRAACTAQAPVLWAHWQGDAAHERIMAVASRFGIGRAGVTLPVRGLSGDLGVLSVSATGPADHWQTLLRPLLPELQDRAAALHHAIQRTGLLVRPDPAPVLSQAEAAILQHRATGTDPVPAGSARLQDVLLASACAKLGATTWHAADLRGHDPGALGAGGLTWADARAARSPAPAPDTGPETKAVGHVRFLTAQTHAQHAQDLTAMFDLRQRRGPALDCAPNAGPGRDLFDALDPVYGLALDDQGQVVGALRLMQTLGPHALARDLPGYIPLRSARIWEMSQLCLSADAALSRQLITATRAFGQAHGISALVTALDARSVRALRRLGHAPFACLTDAQGQIVAGLLDCTDAPACALPDPAQGPPPHAQPDAEPDAQPFWDLSVLTHLAQPRITPQDLHRYRMEQIATAATDQDLTAALALAEQLLRKPATAPLPKAQTGTRRHPKR